MDKKQTRLRRARRTRIKIRELGIYRLTIHRTPKHIYAQIITPNNLKVVTSASTNEKNVRNIIEGYTGNIKAAETIGQVIAERAKQASIKIVAFDRSGFKYHGRIKALADAARKNGLKF